MNYRACKKLHIFFLAFSSLNYTRFLVSDTVHLSTVHPHVLNMGSVAFGRKTLVGWCLGVRQK